MVSGGRTVLNYSVRDIGWMLESSSLHTGFARSGTGRVKTVNAFKMRLNHHLRNVRGIYKHYIFFPADGHLSQLSDCMHQSKEIQVAMLGNKIVVGVTCLRNGGKHVTCL